MRYVLLLSVCANFSAGVARLIIGPVVPDITQTFTVSKSVIGLALTGMWAAFAILQFPSGILSDRFGERQVILFSLACLCVGSLLVSVAPSFVLFGIFINLVGAGSGLYLIASSSFLTKRFDNTGGVLGIHGMGTSLAGLFGPIAAAFISIRYGWRIALLLGFVLTGLVFVVFRSAVKRTNPDVPGETTPTVDLELLSRLLRHRGLVSTMLIAATAYFCWQATVSFFPTFLIEYRQMSTRNASVAFATLFALGAIGKPIFGRLSDSHGRDIVIALCLLVSAIGYLLLIFTGDRAIVILGVFFLGTGFGWEGVLQSRFMDNLVDRERGIGYGFVNTLANLIGSLGSVVTGTLAAYTNWMVSVSVLIGLLVGTAVFISVGLLFGGRKRNAVRSD